MFYSFMGVRKGEEILFQFYEFAQDFGVRVSQYWESHTHTHLLHPAFQEAGWWLPRGRSGEMGIKKREGQGIQVTIQQM